MSENFRSQFQEWGRSQKQQFRSLTRDEKRSLRAAADIGEIDILPIVEGSADSFGINIERYGVLQTRQDFNLFSLTAGQNFFRSKGDRDFAFLPGFGEGDRILVDPESEYQVVHGMGSRSGALLYELDNDQAELIAAIAGTTQALSFEAGIIS